jgi:hypothetical protein
MSEELVGKVIQLGDQAAQLRQNDQNFRWTLHRPSRRNPVTLCPGSQYEIMSCSQKDGGFLYTLRTVEIKTSAPHHLKTHKVLLKKPITEMPEFATMVG